MNGMQQVLMGLAKPGWQVTYCNKLRNILPNGSRACPLTFAVGLPAHQVIEAMLILGFSDESMSVNSEAGLLIFAADTEPRHQGARVLRKVLLQVAGLDSHGQIILWRGSTLERWSIVSHMWEWVNLALEIAVLLVLVYAVFF